VDAKPRPVVVPELEGENVMADELPEDEWLRLGRELLARGEFRLATRAFFLASLAMLADRELLILARYKSNRDYERELVRRGGAGSECVSAFTGNRRVFEAVWYGGHFIDAAGLAEFENRLLDLRGGGS
jgi:hypothetical protein